MSRLAIRCGTVLLGLTMLAAAPAGIKTVTLICQPGWRGSAVGQYGGVSFGVQCDNGRGRVRLTGTTNTAYSVRAGIESDEIAADCFFSGDAQVVNETCAQVRLQIR